MKLEDEIRNALLPGSPDEETRKDWARDALERSPAPRRRRIRPLWPGLAAAALLTLFFWPREKAPGPTLPAHEDAEDEAGARLKTTSVDEQRAANLAFLEDAEKRGTLGDARKGSWVVVVGGDSLRIAKTLEDGLAWADKLYPEAKHRLLVPIANDAFSRGDVIGDRSSVALGIAGRWFFQNVGRKPELQKEIVLDVGGKTLTFRVDLDSSAPLILPAGVAFPRFEIPGAMILEDMDRNWRAFRRYFVRVRGTKPNVDEWTEVIGAESADRYAPGNWIAVRLGTHVFHALRRTPAEQAAKEGKPLLVLRFAEGSTEYLNELFEGVEIEGFAQLAVPQAKSTVVQRFDKQGTLVAQLALPDAKPETATALRKFLRGG